MLAAAQGLAMLLGLDVLIGGLARPFRLEFGMDTLLVFAAAATQADALTMPLLDSREGEMPYCAAIILGIALLLKGTARKRRGPAAGLPHGGLRLPPLSGHPGRGQVERPGHLRQVVRGSPSASAGRCRPATGPQRIFQRIVALLLIASLLLSIVASIGRGAPRAAAVVPVRHAYPPPPPCREPCASLCPGSPCAVG